MALAVASLLLVATGFLPQFGGPGYESALAGGLILPSVAAIATALLLVRAPQPTANGPAVGHFKTEARSFSICSAVLATTFTGQRSHSVLTR